MTMGTPSAESCTSSVMKRAPSSMAERRAGKVFSGYSAAFPPRATRCNRRCGRISGLPSLLEAHHRLTARHRDLPFDHRPLGDGDAACADLSTNHGCCADFELIVDDQAPNHGPRDDGLLSPYIAF